MTALADGADRPVQTSTSGRYLRIRIGDPAVTVTGVHTYTIGYRIEGRGANLPGPSGALLGRDREPMGRADQPRGRDGKGPRRITKSRATAAGRGSALPCVLAARRGTVATFSQTDLGA